MRRRLFFLLALTLACTLEGQPTNKIFFEPAAPNSQSAVTVHVHGQWGDVCGPNGVRVEHSGKTHTVTWFQVSGPWACSAQVVPWAGSALLGTLEPGLNDIILQVEIFGTLSGFATATINVAEAHPTVLMSSPLAEDSGGRKIYFSPISGACLHGCASTNATIGGVTVPLQQIDPMTFVATAPPHATGAVDVTVRFDDKTVFLPAALHYFDADAAPDGALFERVLVPVIYSGPGAFGSEWRTDAALHVSSGGSLTFHPNVGKPACVSPCENDTLPALANFPLAAFGQHPNGLLLFLPRHESRNVLFSAVVRDVSRQSMTWGSEMPIVRERNFTRGALTFPSVPIEARYRQTLRIYGVDGVKSDVLVRVGTESRTITLESPCTTAPCNVNEPAFASIFDLSAEFPTAVGQGPARITVTPVDMTKAFRYWAVISATNNETQHITIITPQIP